MAKQKKKRNKKYAGAGAASARPSITHVSAVHRSPVRQWLHDHTRSLRISGMVAGAALVIILIISGIMSLF